MYIYIYKLIQYNIRGTGVCQSDGRDFRENLFTEICSGIENALCSGKPVADHMGDHGLVANELLIPMKNPNLYLE